jgi:ABC-type cobalamin/Fe3+-siderophores transport system ATPase subunit
LLRIWNYGKIEKTCNIGEVDDIQKFSLNNIKSFSQSKEIEIKPITVFVGKNSCGKSNLLRFPVMLAQTFREETLTPLLLFGNLIDYGNYDDVAYRHGTVPLGFRISFGP